MDATCVAPGCDARAGTRLAPFAEGLDGARLVRRPSCFSFFSARFSLMPFAAFFLTFFAPLSFACAIVESSVAREEASVHRPAPVPYDAIP